MPDASPIVRSVGTALPPHVATQDEIIEALRGLWTREHFNPARLEALHRAVKVKTRHLARPLSEYAALDSFQRRNDAWLDSATALGADAVRDAVSRAGLSLKDVSHLTFVSVTGVATPSVDARLVNLLGLRTDVKRTPIFGLGCVAGAAGLARAADTLRAFPGEVSVLLSVELCSLTLQRDDLSVANVISSGLFGDAAAAVVLEGAGRSATGPRVVASESVFYPDTERVMGWDVGDGGLKVVLSQSVPALIRERIGGDVDRFLAAHGLARSDIDHWVLHTGGPKVLEAFEDALTLPEGALHRSWKSLETIGNCSSASVLHVLADLEASNEPQAGQWGLLAAMGPGFCAELVLLRW